MGESAIRVIFPLFVLAMWGAGGAWLAAGSWTALHWLLTGAAAAVCLVVFLNFVYVFNYGYATSMIILNFAILSLQGARPATLLICGLLMLYGARLWIFAYRRYASRGYAGNKAAIEAAHRQMPLPVKMLLWVQTSTLFTFHAMTSYNVALAGRVTPFVIAGALLIAAGLALETIADAQKQRAKDAQPEAFVSVGLFHRSRHPNYLGEIVFQAGVIIAGLGSASGLAALVAGMLAPLYIIVLMLGMARRGDAIQQRRYGADPGYREYRGRTGALLPRLG